MPDSLKSKAEFQQMLERILNPLKNSYNQSGALLSVGNTSAHYPDRVAELEGFARVLWGLVPYWKGGGENIDLLKTYQKGLAAGTDPTHPDYWDVDGEVNQRYVEMAAISLGLLLVPELLWEPLSPNEKENLAVWLDKINSVDRDVYPDCNWWFFIVLTNMALNSLGKPGDPALVEFAFERIESFYLGDGWYTDGTSGRRDYYVSFAIHFYSLIYVAFMQEKDPARCEKFFTRADRFAVDFLYWFDEEGRAVPYGRSLTYRFAQGAFWSAYLFAGGKAVPVGVVKGMLARHLEQWMEQPIFDRDGILTIGYRYPCLNMAETYNAPGSPYWALKTFLLLALPDEHPFWQAEAQPLPQLDALGYFPKAEMLIQHLPRQAVLYPSGIFRNDSFGHMPEKYGKFAYSTEFGFSVAVGDDDLELAAPDSMLAFEWDGYIFIRRNAKEALVEQERVRSVWSPIEGITVETVLLPKDSGHVRKHTITNTLGACVAYDCGFAVPAPAPNRYTSATKSGGVSVSHEGASCTVNMLTESGTPQVIVAAPNTNLMCSKTAIPCIKYDIPEGTIVLETEIIAEAKT